MEGYDILTDSYSSELIVVMIVERLWSKIKNYLDDKGETKKEVAKEKRLADMEKKIAVNTALDKERSR